MKDLYEVIGLQKGASEQDIKRAYRKLAAKYHPDVNNDKGSDEKFKEITTAYETLSDHKKRAHYDQFGSTEGMGGSGGFGGGNPFGGGGGGNKTRTVSHLTRRLCQFTVYIRALTFESRISLY